MPRDPVLVCEKLEVWLLKFGVQALKVSVTLPSGVLTGSESEEQEIKKEKAINRKYFFINGTLIFN